MLPTNLAEQVVVGIANYGSYGVELFFILSGFLIPAFSMTLGTGRIIFATFTCGAFSAYFLFTMAC